MLPGAALGAICGLIAGTMFDKHGIRGVTIVGFIVLLVGVAGYFSFGAHSSLILVCVTYGVACIGLQSLITPMNTWGINSLPNTSVPHGNTIVSTMEQVGSSLGTAFVVSLAALWPLFAPNATDPMEQSYAGCHIAFLGILGIAIVVAVLILAFVKDKHSVKKPVQSADSATFAIGGAPGVDRPWLVADVMNTAPDKLSPASTVRDAIEVMQRTETSGLPIVRDNGTVAGFISDGDILKRVARHNVSREEGSTYRVLAEAENIQERLSELLDKPVLELATKNVVTVDIEDGAEDAFMMLAARRIKKVPVMREGQFAGTLSRRNVMKVLTAMEGAVATKH